MAESEMIFSADSNNVLAEVRKLIDQNKALEKSMTAASKAAKTGADIATAAYQQQNAATKRLIDQNDSLKSKLDEVKRKQQEAGGAGEIAWGNIASTVATRVVGALKQAVDMQLEYNRGLAEAARLQDDAGRRLQVQGLISNEDFKKRTLPSIHKVAQKGAVELKEAQAIAAELVSQGASEEEATGGFLEEIIMGAKATSTTDIKGFATSVSGFLKSQGKALTKENARELTTKIAALFGPTSLQGSDLSQLAQIGAVTKEFGLNQETALAAFTTLKDQGNFEPEMAKTGLRNIVTKLATARNTKATQDKFEKAFGKGALQDFDLVGESLPQALQNLKDKLETVDQESRNSLLEELFGKENIAAGTTLLNGMDKFQDFIKAQRDTSVLEKGAVIGTQGVRAGQIRQQNQEDFDLHQKKENEAKKEQIWKAVEHNARMKGDSEFIVKWGSYMAQFGRDKNETPEQLKQAMLKDLPDFQRQEFENLLNGVEGQGKGSEMTPMNVPLANVPFVKGAGPFKGPKKNIFEKLPEEKELEQLQEQKRDLELQRKQAQFQAEDEKSEGGTKVTPGERKMIEQLQHLLDKIDIQTDELKKKHKNLNAGVEG